MKTFGVLKMKKIITFVISFLLVGFTFSRFYEIKAERTAYNVNVTATYETGNQPVVPLGERAYGSTVTPYTVLPVGYQFVYWIVNGFVQSTDTYQMNHEFIVTTDLELIAVFAPTAPQMYAVVFVDSNGKQLGATQYVTSGGTATAPSSDLPTKPLFNLAATESRWKTLDGSNQLTNITGHKLFTLQYVSMNPAKQYTLVVNNANGDGLYAYNEIATASASLNPTNFSHWIDTNGTIISYKLDYTFTMVKNTEVTAVYSDTPLTPVPIVAFSGDLAIRSGYHTYMGRFEKPSGYEVLEYGFLLFSDAVEELTFDTAGVIIAKSNSFNIVTNEFVTSFLIGSHEIIRSYMVITDGITTTNIYSEMTRYIYTITYNLDGGTNSSSNPIVYNADTPTITFEPATKTGYTFDGWYDNSEFAGDAITSITVGSVGNVTLYAKWYSN